MKPVVIVFAKAPRMGVAKTRLAREIGPVTAWRAKRRLDAKTLRSARDPRWHTVLAVAPQRDRASHFPGAWPKGVRRSGQGLGDLGARMCRALAAPGGQPSRGPAALIGSDAPDLRAADLALAFKALRRHDIVFGPASDGGFWLIGACPRVARKLDLDGVRWSSPDTLEETLARLDRRWRVGLLRRLSDVDDAAGWRGARFRARR